MSEAAKESAMTTDEGTSSLHKGLTFSYDGGPLLSNQAIKDRKEWLKTNQWDTISIGRHIPSNVKYVVVDVETHDWNIFDYNDRSESRVVELAWMLIDNKGEHIESKQYLLKPHGYKEISNKAVDVHGITTNHVIEHGSDASDVFSEFVSIISTIPMYGFVIAYNIEIMNSIFTSNVNQEHQNTWNIVPKCGVSTLSLWEYPPTRTRSTKSRVNSETEYLFRLYGLHRIVYSVDRQEESNCLCFACDNTRMIWDMFYLYSRYASYHELKWQH